MAGPEGAGQVESQMHLQSAAAEPGADAVERRPLDNGQAKHLLIEGERPREIRNDDTNVVERKVSHSDDSDAVPTPPVGLLRHTRFPDFINCFIDFALI
jgi:hypothetical protein